MLMRIRASLCPPRAFKAACGRPPRRTLSPTPQRPACSRTRCAPISLPSRDTLASTHFHAHVPSAVPSSQQGGSECRLQDSESRAISWLRAAATSRFEHILRHQADRAVLDGDFSLRRLQATEVRARTLRLSKTARICVTERGLLRRRNFFDEVDKLSLETDQISDASKNVSAVTSAPSVRHTRTARHARSLDHKRVFIGCRAGGIADRCGRPHTEERDR